MTASRTPRLDALREWMRGGRTGEIVWPVDPTPDWPTPWTPAERLRTIVASCASGWPGAAAVRRVVVDRTGRQIPPPPSRRTR
jgi:hypothetical protein